MDWNDNLRQLAVMAGEAGYQDDPDFLAIMESCVIAGENRILRDFDLLSTRVTDDTGKLTQNSKLFILPRDVGTFIVIEQLRVITPSTPPGARGIYGPPLLPASKDTIDWMWPSSLAFTGVPTMWAPNDQASVFIGGPPDQDYLMSAFGTMRPASLSPKTDPNTGKQMPTFISTQMRDIFLASEMIFITAEQHNWSAMGDDPASARNWTAEYQSLKTPGLIEEFRKKVQSVGFSTRLPSPTIDTPPEPRD